MASAPFKDKVVAITGAASGIGLQLTKLLADQGVKLSLCDIQKEPLEMLRQDLENTMGNCSVMTRHVDVRETSQVDEWIESTIETYGRLDHAANLAGVIRASGRISAIKEDDWDLIMDINVKGLMKCLRAELAIMEKHGFKGSIVNAGSISSIQGTGMYSAYCASKHAVLGITRCAAKEVASKGIRVNAICPGLIDTPMVADESRRIGKEMVNPNLLGRRGTADEVARVILFLLSDDSSFITGSAQDVLGGGSS